MNRQVTFAVKSALGMAILAPAALVYGQTAPSSAPATSLEEVVVTGIRYSVERSLEAKRNSNSVVEIIAAEDIGKMPDKNVADSLSRIPGVTISAAGASEGGFDEADRVSMRGTNPSLTQTTVNGHSVNSGDWFVLDQAGTVGRSVSYTMLPSEIVSQVVVHKSSEAQLLEGGVAGSVDIVTRKPLDFKNPVTLEASAGAVFADLPGTTDPQFNALGNWINDDRTLGVLLQVFSETRHLRRDGQEILGYAQIAPGSAVATAHPDLANVFYPNDIGAALFEQRRQRNGGLLDVQYQPNDRLNFDASYFTSKMDASNFNRNFLMWTPNFINGGAGQSPDAGYVVHGNTLTQANFTGVAGTQYGIYDQISRPDEGATSSFVNLDVTLKASDKLTLKAQLGTSHGQGKTPRQDVFEANEAVGTGAGWSFNGIHSPANWNLGSAIVNTPTPGGTPVSLNWIFGAQNTDVKDQENWAKIDAEFTLDQGAWKDLKFGVRGESHERYSAGVIAQGPAFGPNGGAFNPGNYPQGFSNYPTNFGLGLGGSFPGNIWYWTPAQLAAFDSQFTNRAFGTNAAPGRDYPPFDFDIAEKDTAAYVQADFGGDGWSGNIGVRVVQTKEHAVNFANATIQTPGAILDSAFGPFVAIPTDHTYTDVLPSANLKFDLSPDLVARFAAAETMARPDYSAWAGGLGLTPPAAPGGAPGAGSGPNPDLKPILSTNLDAGLEWYFAKRSLLSVGLFYMDLRTYVAYGNEVKTYATFNGAYPNGFPGVYDVTVPVNAKGRVQGAEFAYQQALTKNFGIETNYTYADGKQTSRVQINGDDRLVGTSKTTFNASAYFETQKFSARVAYNYRSAFYSGLDRSSAFTQAATGSLAASLQYQVNDNLSIALDGMNLNNPTLKYYSLSEDQPRAFYKNGSQFYLNLRMKL
jgi:iron complex outermembrane receptor protein